MYVCMYKKCDPFNFSMSLSIQINFFKKDFT